MKKHNLLPWLAITVALLVPTIIFFMYRAKKNKPIKQVEVVPGNTGIVPPALPVGDYGVHEETPVVAVLPGETVINIAPETFGEPIQTGGVKAPILWMEPNKGLYNEEIYKNQYS